MGDSIKAYDANLLVHHMVAVMYLLRRRYPHIVFTLENPMATLAHHPLMTILESDVRNGGLGMRIAYISYCVYGKEFPYKPTLLWTNSNLLYNVLMPMQQTDTSIQRYPSKKCTREECDCGSFGRHGSEQGRHGVRGNSHIYNTERYPDHFCNDVCLSINQEVHDRYTLFCALMHSTSQHVPFAHPLLSLLALYKKWFCSASLCPAAGSRLMTGRSWTRRGERSE